MSNWKNPLLVRVAAWALVIAFSVQAIWQPPANAAKAPSPIEINLPNGLKVLILEEYSFPVVSCFMWYRVGARNEVPGSTGLSHLVEHLLFGNVGVFKKGDIGSAVIRNGGHFNGFTSDDFTTFFETLPPSKLDLALKIESERMRKANFTQKDVDSEVNNIASEFERKNKDPLDLLSQEVRTQAYQEHPYHHPTIGWLNDVRNISVSDARNFYNRYFWPDNATLVIAGDVKASNVINQVKKYFGNIAKSPETPATNISQEPEPKGERRVSIKFAGKQEILQVAYHVPSITDADAPALAVLEELFNAAYSGRLKTKLVTSKICNSAAAALGARKDPGLFTITLTAPLGTGEQKLLDALDATIAGVRSTLLPDADLRRSKNLAEFAYESETDGPYHAGFFLGYSACLDSWQLTKTWADKLHAVTASDIAKVSRQYFNADDRVVGFLYNPNFVKPATPSKPTPATDTQPQAPETRPFHPNSRPYMHTHLTGYKLDDASTSPEAENKTIPVTDSKASTPTPESATGATADDNKQSKLPIQGTIGPSGNALNQDKAAQAKSEAPADSLKVLPPEIKHFQERVLKNGLKVVVFESHLSPIVQIQGSILAGDAFESENKKGLATLVAQVLNNGSQKHNHNQMCQEQEDLGLNQSAMLNFEDDKDNISFQTRCLSRDLTSQLNIIAETLTQPNLQDDDLDKVKQDEIAAIKQQELLLEGRVKRVLLANLVSSKSPYCPTQPADKIKNITAFKSSDIKDFISQHLVPGATTIVFAGDVTIDQAARMAESSFESFQASGHAQLPPARVTNKRVLRTTIPIKDKEAIIAFGQLLPVPSNNHEYSSLLIANCILVKHPLFARLQKCLTSNGQLAVSADNLHSEMEPVSYETIWSIIFPTEPELMNTCLGLLEPELKKFTQLGLAPEELIEAKRYLNGHIPVATMANLTQASKTILNNVREGNESGYLSRLLNEINGQSLESVNRFIRTGFKPDQATMVLAAPSEFLKANRSAPAASAASAGKDNADSTVKP